MAAHKAILGTEEVFLPDEEMARSSGTLKTTGRNVELWMVEIPENGRETIYEDDANALMTFNESGEHIVKYSKYS